MDMKRDIKRVLSGLLMAVGMLLLPFSASASESEGEGGKINMKEMIFGHINDAYSWHICTIDGHHVSIPLPCIVFGDDGPSVFMSYNLGHEGAYKEYNGYKIAESGDYVGKIVKVSDGTRPFDISITKNVLSLLMSCALMLWIFLSVAKKYKENYWRKPTGLQAYVEPLVMFVQEDIEANIPGNAKKFSPYLLTAFFFILINNFLGLIPIFPGGANLTGNIACTLVLAVLTFIMTNVYASKHYWIDLVWPDVPMGLKCPLPLMPIVEIIGVFTKPLALCIRLFANMLSGHITPLVLIGMIFIMAQISLAVGGVAAVFACLVVVFMMVLECLVCFLQAYVFTLLSAIFIGLAQTEPHHEAE